MNRIKFFAIALIAGCILTSGTITAQEEEKESPISVGADLVNRYVFRGLDFGNSPAIQPSLEFSLGGFAIGAWGSYSFLSTPAGIEADLYASYGFDFGLSIGATDYYFPGEYLQVDGGSGEISAVRSGKYFDYGENHYFELNVNQAIKDFYVSANWGFSNMDNALYFEAGYSFKFLSAFVGAGNEVYTQSGKFNIVNVGISASKDIKMGEKFSLPVSTSVILNPNAEQIHFVFGITI